MSFSNPLALILLLAIPYFIWLGWPRVAYRRRRDATSLFIRVIIILLLVLGLSGLQVTRAADKLSVVFVVDASDSIDQNARDQAEKYIRDAMSHMTPEDRAGIVVFGKNALVDRPVSNGKELSAITSVPIRLDTNVAGAIRLALAMFPSNTAKRIVLLSDGVETLDNAAEAARLAAATGVKIDVVPLRRQQGPEVLVTDVRLPTTVNQNQIFDLGITVDSQIDTAADLTVLSAGAVIQTTRVNLKQGTNNFVLSLAAPRQGFTDFQVRVDPVSGSDTFYQNNELAAFSEVTGPPRILIVTSSPDETTALLPALEGQGIEVDVMSPEDLPIGLAPLAAYKSVVLANVSATQLSEQRMQVLQTYVRELGGGLAVIGGPDSFGPGGYFQTPLEEALPVESRIKDQKRIPKLLMVYVIDRSGSMEAIEPGNSKTNLELAKEAARRSVNFLFPEDRVGVLSFDSNPQWLAPIQQVQSRDKVINLIGQLRPGGGTDILAAIQEISRTVPADEATLKHVILLTDGGADPNGIVPLVKQLNDQNNITTTAIGIGRAVPNFMKDISRAGGGIYYQVTNVGSLPQIFAAETVLATRAYILEEEFTPGQTANSQIMQGINGVPSLLGYVATSAKDTATVILNAPGFNDPILAAWQYGLGRSVVWTSDATTRWGTNWTSWENYGRFFSQMIRYTITEGTNNRIDSRVEMRDGQAVLIVEARDEDGGFINNLDMDAAVVDPRLQGQTVKLRQVAPGRYETEFTPAAEGAYFIRVGGSDGQNTGVAQTTGWVLSYSPEYRLRDTNTNLLDDVARITGGTIISNAPSLAFVHNISETAASTALWPYLLLVVTILLPMDIAIRRLMVTQTDLRRASNWVVGKLGLRRVSTDAATSGRLSRLKDAKDRATTTTITAASKEELVSERVRQPEPVMEQMAQPQSTYTPPAPSVTPTPIISTPPKPVVPTQSSSAPATLKPPIDSDDDATGHLASRLLSKRKKRGD